MQGIFINILVNVLGFYRYDYNKVAISERSMSHSKCYSWLYQKENTELYSQNNTRLYSMAYTEQCCMVDHSIFLAISDLLLPD